MRFFIKYDSFGNIENREFDSIEKIYRFIEEVICDPIGRKSSGFIKWGLLVNNPQQEEFNPDNERDFLLDQKDGDYESFLMQDFEKMDVRDRLMTGVLNERYSI